jgi:hypothetical protein
VAAEFHRLSGGTPSVASSDTVQFAPVSVQYPVNSTKSGKFIVHQSRRTQCTVGGYAELGRGSRAEISNERFPSTDRFLLYRQVGPIGSRVPAGHFPQSPFFGRQGKRWATYRD